MQAPVVNITEKCRNFFETWLISLCKEQLNSGCDPIAYLETQTSYLMCVPINLCNMVFFQLWLIARFKLTRCM